MKLEKVNEHFQRRLKDPRFRKLYSLEEQKLAVVKRIIDYRIKHKISQKELAENAGVSQQHISKIENGEFSNIATLEKVLVLIGYAVKIQVVPIKRGLGKAA